MGTGVAAARRKISSSMLLTFAADLGAKLFGVFGVWLSSIGLLGPAELLGSDNLAVTPLFDIDTIELELICFGISGISTPLPFRVDDWATIAFCSRFWGISVFLGVLGFAGACGALAFSALVSPGGLVVCYSLTVLFYLSWPSSLSLLWVLRGQTELERLKLKICFQTEEGLLWVSAGFFLPCRWRQSCFQVAIY